MPRYAFKEPASDIEQIDVRMGRAYLTAQITPRKDLSQQQLEALPARLQKHGLAVTRMTEDGALTLRVSKFDKTSDLLDIIRREGLVAANDNMQKEPLEEELIPEVKTLRQYLKEHSIQLAGAVYLIADAMPIMSGIVRKTPAEVLSGSLFATTSLGLLLFGRKNPEMQMGNMYAKMQDFMVQEGIELSDDQGLTLEQLKTDPSYINKMINFLYEHPVLFNNTIQGYGCYKGHEAGKQQGNPWKNIAGLSGAAGQWGGLLIPEDKYAGLDPAQKSEKLRLRAKGEEPENGFNTSFTDNPIAWVQEKPLRFTMLGTIFQNFLVGASAAFHDRHEVNKYFGYESKKYELNPLRIIKDMGRGTNELLAQKGVSMEDFKADKALASTPWARKHAGLESEVSRQMGLRFTMASPFFNIIANTLYGMSSKEERSVNLDKEGYIDELLDVAANIYAQAPKEQRGEKIMRFAGFLKSQPDVNLNEKDIRSRLEQKVDTLQNSGWMAKIANENTAPAQSASL